MSFIDAHTFSVDLVLRVLGIPASTYYDWRARRVSPSRRQLEDTRLLEMIVKIRTAHEFAGTYGSPRVWLELCRQGVRVGRKRVERIMRDHGLQGAFLRKGWKGGSTTQNPRHSSAPDLVDRQFTADEPNRLWVADLTRITTGESVLWLASVRDAFSNKVVGWATAARADTALVLTALNHALPSRHVQGGQLIHHSDKGWQYTSWAFGQRLRSAGLLASMGTVGDCYDNSMMESFWGTLQLELLDTKQWKTREELAAAIFEWIECWYNPKRRHSSIGMHSPVTFEALHAGSDQDH